MSIFLGLHGESTNLHIKGDMAYPQKKIGWLPIEALPFEECVGPPALERSTVSPAVMIMSKRLRNSSLASLACLSSLER